MSYDITEALQKMEEELIQSMKRNLQRHLDEEDDEGFDWAQWQAEKLNSIARYRAQNRKIIGDYTSTIPQQIDDMIRKSYETGRQQEEIRILKAIRQGYLAASAPAVEISTGFFTVNERKLNALVKATQGEMHKGISSILRYQDDIYRKTIFRSAAQFNMGGLSLGQAVDAATKDFLAQGIQNIRYKDGRCVNIASYAEMALRTANLRANIQGEAAKRDAWGICTVKLSAHGSACPKCIPWQGKVYYDDVYSSIPVPKDGKYPLLSTAIEGGALHPNCKNGVHTWFEGINEPPREMTQEEIDEANRRYDLEQQQRYCERNVRKYKRMKLGAIDPENAAKYAAQEQAWRKRLNSLVKENKDVLRIDYRRLKVYDAPAPPAGKPTAVPPSPKPKAAKAKAHTEGVSAEHAVEVAPPATKDNVGYSPEKIEHEEDFKITKKNISNGFSVNRELVNAKQYHDKFSGLTEHKAANESVYQQAKKILEDRDGKDTERMAIIDARTGELLTDNLSVGEDSRFKTGLSFEEYQKIKESGKRFLILHNHPSSTRPSITDILTFWKEEKADASIVVGHDGTVYVITDMNRKIPLDKLYEKYYNDYIAEGYGTDLSRLKATDTIYSLGAFAYKIKSGKDD